MPFTISSTSFDANGVQYSSRISVPDSGVNIGAFVAVYLASGTLALSPVLLTHPGVPGSGTNFVLLQVNTTTGTVTFKTATDAFPAADDGNTGIAQQSVATGSPATPYSWTGWQFLF